MGVLSMFAYFYLVTLIHRCQFYFVFILNDSIGNAAGLGFEGYDEKGQPKWTLATNSDIIAFEFATSMRSGINAWNITTARWLRRCV